LFSVCGVMTKAVIWYVLTMSKGDVFLRRGVLVGRKIKIYNMPLAQECSFEVLICNF